MRGITTRATALLGTIIVVAAGVTVGTTTGATADPTPGGGACGDIILVGSGETQPLMAGVSEGFVLGDVSYLPVAPLSDIVSYPPGAPMTLCGGGTPLPGPPVSPGPGTGPVSAPVGCGGGIEALSAAWDPANHVWDGVTLSNEDITAVRCSYNSGTAYSSSDDLAYIPVARNAMGVVTKGLNISNFTTDELEALYGTGDQTDGTYTQVSGTVSVGDIEASGSGATQEEFYVTAVSGTAVTTRQIVPAIPQPGSDARNFFLNAIGSLGGSFGSWVQDNGGDENDVTSVPVDGIFPFSGAALIEQLKGQIPDTGVTGPGTAFPEVNGQTLITEDDANAAPGSLYGDASTLPADGTGVFDHDDYTVVPSSQLDAAYDGDTLQDIFDNLLPNATDSDGNFVVADYGFEHEEPTYTEDQSTWYGSPFQH